jgi:hypothetical protein
MFASNESLARAKQALRVEGNSDVAALRSDRLDALLGSSSWLSEEDNTFETVLTSLPLTQDEQDGFEVAVAETDNDQCRSLVAWFYEVLARMEGGGATPPPDEQGESAQGPRYLYVTPVEGYPRLWSAWDTQAEDANMQWRYWVGDGHPDDSSPGWTDQESAYAAFQPRYRDISPVDGWQGWWVARDVLAPDQSDAWRYVNSQSEPDDDAKGWLEQSTAFARMSGIAADEITEGPDGLLAPEALEMLVAEALQPVLDEFRADPGFAGITPEELEAALVQALNEIAAG